MYKYVCVHVSVSVFACVNARDLVCRVLHSRTSGRGFDFLTEHCAVPLNI